MAPFELDFLTNGNPAFGDEGSCAFYRKAYFLRGPVRSGALPFLSGTSWHMLLNGPLGHSRTEGIRPMADRRCHNCAMNNYDWLETCGRCGAILDTRLDAMETKERATPHHAQEEQRPTAGRRCPMCGKHNPDFIGTCGHCGRLLEALESKTATAPSKGFKTCPKCGKKVRVARQQMLELPIHCCCRMRIRCRIRSKAPNGRRGESTNAPG